MNPAVQNTGVARTINPPTVAAGNPVDDFRDSVGREVMQLYQIRSLITTAFAVCETANEVTLLAGIAGEFHDLVQLTCVNTTGAAQSLALHETTAGGTTLTFTVAANATETRTFPAPVSQSEAGSSWTVQVTTGAIDASAINTNVSGIFLKNV